ncbi:MAG: trigger factor [Verrucomicrobia bacterium]|nr:trigger factor [Verrucomicrobiota bacterium]
MNITVEKQPNCLARIQVEVPAEAVSGERRQIVQAFSKQAKIPGFRPGKIPVKVIEKRFATQITEELESRLVSQAYDEAIKKEELRVLDARKPEKTDYLPDGGFSFTSSLILAPEFELPDYKSLTIEIPDREITGKDIDREIEQVRARFAEFNDITDRDLAAGDFAIIDYTGTLDGTPLEEALGHNTGYLANGEGFWLKMDDESFLPGFTKALEGAKSGSEQTFEIPVPDDFPSEDLRGKSIAYTVTVTAIKEQVLPEFTDELAAQIIPGKTVAELRDIVKDQLEVQLNRQIHEMKVNQLIDKLSQSVDFELPEDILTAETQGQADEMVERGIRSGMTEEQIEAQQRELFAAAGQRARLNVKTDFILQEVAKREDVKITEAELTQRVAAMAQQSKKPFKTVVKDLQKSGRLRGLQHSMLLSKTIDFLLEGAKVEFIPADNKDDE